MLKTAKSLVSVLYMLAVSVRSSPNNPYSKMVSHQQTGNFSVISVFYNVSLGNGTSIIPIVCSYWRV